MKVSRGRLLSSLSAGLGLAALLLPASAQAHGIVGKADLPIPVWLFSWAAAIVLVVSFVALSTLWQQPQLQEQHRRRLFRLPRALRLAREPRRGGAVRARALQRVRRRPGAERELLGDVHLRDLLGRHAAGERAVRGHLPCLQPVADVRPRDRRDDRCAGSPASGPPAAALPEVARAVAVGGGDRGLRLAGARLHPGRPRAPEHAGRAVARVLPGDARAGWRCSGSRSGGGRPTASGSTSTCSHGCRRCCATRTGSCTCAEPLSGITDLPIRAGTVALICTIIGTTTFDGFSNGGVWRNIEPSLGNLFSRSGLQPDAGARARLLGRADPLHRA